jgi:hypothetical protein
LPAVAALPLAPASVAPLSASHQVPYLLSQLFLWHQHL